MTKFAAMAAAALGYALSAGMVPAALAESAGPPDQTQMTNQLTPVPPALKGHEQGIPVPGEKPAESEKHYIPTSTGAAPASPPAPSSTPEREPAAATGAAPRAGCAPSAAAGNPSVSLKWVTFQFGSAELRPEAIAILQTLGKTLKDHFSDSIFVIEGHTDATGTFDYNRELSLQRAQAVKDYLAKQTGIDPDHLQVVGLGYCDLANPADPRGAENRRVVVVNKTS